MHRTILKDMHEGRVVAGEMFKSLALPILPDRPESLNSDRDFLPGPTMILNPSSSLPPSQEASTIAIYVQAPKTILPSR